MKLEYRALPVPAADLTRYLNKQVDEGWEIESVQRHAWGKESESDGEIETLEYMVIAKRPAPQS
jgi:hypothetical protein